MATNVKTIVIAAPKGGTGKTTITAALAVEAAKSAPTAVVDLNFDQASLTQWWELRGQDSPTLVDIDPEEPDALSAALQAAAEAGMQYVIVDTAPYDLPLLAEVVKRADVVITPCRPSVIDVLAITALMDMVRAHRKTQAFVLSAVDSKMSRIVDQAIMALGRLGPILASRVGYRAAYISAMTVGKTGPEISDEAADEIAALWAEVQRLADGATTPTAKMRGRIYGSRTKGVARG